MKLSTLMRCSVATLGTVSGCTAPTDEPVLTAADEAITSVAARVLDGRDDLELTSVRHSLTGSHARYRRIATDGTRIVDAEVAVHQLGAAGQARRVSVFDRNPAPVRLEGQRAITQDVAEARARAAVLTGVISAVSVEAVALPTADRAVVQPGFLAVVETREPAHEWEVWITGAGTASVKRDRLKFVDGTGLVYDPNPLMQTGNLALVDGNDAATPALDAARIAVTLPLLDGTGDLRGPWANARQAGTRATSPTNAFAYDRADNRFEEVMAYFHVTRVQQRLQALGFIGVTGANARQQDLVVNAGNADNSFYSPGSKGISFGAGGVDDAEDADIIVHEYGHAVQDNIVPGWGASAEAGAMGEGFGDLLAASLEPVDAANLPMIDRACVGAWDATSYDDREPPCLRRIDGRKHYPEAVENQVHADGEIWSAAAWILAADLGDVSLSLRLVIESFFLLSPDASFEEWADAMITVDTTLYAGAHLPAIKKALWDRGVYRVLATPGAFTGVVVTQPTSVGPAGTLANNADASFTITHPGATAIRVHFSTFKMQVGASCRDQRCDSVYVSDANGTLYAILGGALGASDGPIVPGDTAVVRYVTNRNGPSMGFHIDAYDHDSTQGPLVDGAPDGGVPDAGPAPDGALRPDAGNNTNGDDDGGGCSTGGGDASLLFSLGALLFARRRSRR